LEQGNINLFIYSNKYNNLSFREISFNNSEAGWFWVIQKNCWSNESKEHLTIEGLRKIFAIKASLNLGLSEELKVAFLNIIPVKRPLVVDQVIKDPH